MKSNQKGFSLIELLFAGVLFSVFATGIVEVLLSGLETDRLGEETTIATEYASQGLEAVRSIKAKNFGDIGVITATGLVRENGHWIFSGTDNTRGKYTRVVTITDVNRDGNGNIDENRGSSDAMTKKATVTVSWSMTASRHNSVVLNTFFTNWK